MRAGTGFRGRERGWALAGALMAAAAAGAVAWLAGCAANEPFDPNSVPNSPPTVRVFVAPADSGGVLNPTSYNRRTFHWSGTDNDGWVAEYYVSIRTEAAVPAPWDTTTATDTTMTFATDDQGQAEATILVACRDDRGALSDTVSQFIPLRNFPPAINFQSDFEPRANMQRQIIDNGGAAPDTVYWNFGPCNFRLFALDLDGADTMDPFFRYTLMDDEPTVTRDLGDPAADPETGWVRVPFASPDEIKKFEIMIDRIAPGQRTLTVSVSDEGQSDTRFHYTWDVRPPLGDVIYVPDNTTSASRALYTAMLDATVGAGHWNVCEFVYGTPDNPTVLLNTLRVFPVTLWSFGGAVTPALAQAIKRDGALEQYVMPLGDEPAGRLMMGSPTLVGTQVQLTATFIQDVLKLNSDRKSDPPYNLKNLDGMSILGEQPWLPAMTVESGTWEAVGLKLTSACEPLFRFEECRTVGCFGTTSRPPVPPDPVMVARWPLRSLDPLARVISFSVRPDAVNSSEFIAAFGALLTGELGVQAP